MIHPVAAHFAVALPLAALLLGLLYLIKREEHLSHASTQVLVLGALGMIAAWYTGGVEGPDVYPVLSEEAQSLLKEHKSMGLYVMIAVVVAAAVKFFGCAKKVFAAELVAIGMLAIASGMTVYQGSMGGDLVYQHGAGVEKHSDGLDCLEDPEMYLDEEESDEEGDA